ncbi:SUMF1/EgtB/PvdO family nonheme iron enzyme [Parvicella tangerina]|uniref:Sulfatase-modifying factor enzyme-like domain-containing protein n=1 Tax=Parvicella tangerina TaxID=2829795 RepID=A0A916JQP7_9FLAO|nr:SUMF1/EgtB/PvdO family nonheme iron enzyme [Parvicella tangerina]CAG5086604.1 hypothetical protein CRYO30217_03198 [Parvicella tangerina]
MSYLKYISFAVLSLTLSISCTHQSSSTTGWDYNNPENGGFQKVTFEEQETGPGLVLIQGGTFEMALEQDSVTSSKTLEVIVPSYYLDEKEVSNQAYCEYLYWTKRTFGMDYPLVYLNALPDTLAWEKEVGRGNNYVKNYLRHPAYANYPVVGVSWMQANNYCDWRTDRVNEMILIREGILQNNPNQINEDNFNTEAFLTGQYVSGIRDENMLSDLNPYREKRLVRWEDGILLPSYRLPTEVEWEYAASAGVTLDKKTEKKINQTLTHFGQFVNPLYNKEDSFNAYSVLPVDAYIPNDFGIYNLSGNVSEWVADTYLERTAESVDVYAPFIGRKSRVPNESWNYKFDEKLNAPYFDLDQLSSFMQELRERHLSIHSQDTVAMRIFNVVEEKIKEASHWESEGKYVNASMLMVDFIYGELEQMKYSHEGFNDYGYTEELPVMTNIRHYLAKSIIDIPGHIKYEDVSPMDRIKYRNNRLDDYPYYDSIMASNHERVFKGANWHDSEKWITPSFRRHHNKYEGTAFIGFRCAMDRVGSPVGLGKKKKE